MSEVNDEIQLATHPLDLPYSLSFRVDPAYKKWVRELAAHTERSQKQCMMMALREHARSVGFPPPPRLR